MITFNKYFLNKLELTNNTIKLKFSEATLNHLITNRVGKPTTKDEIKYYKNKSSKLSPLVFNKLKPKVKLIKKTLNTDQFPRIDVPEICVYGSYNVGKSTLLNSLLNKSNLCKTNVKTSQLHFYQVGKPPMILLVDMPGYHNTPVRDRNNLTKNTDNDSELENNDNLTNNYNNSNLTKNYKEDNKVIEDDKLLEKEKKLIERENKTLEFSLSYLKYRTNLMLTIILIDSIKGICKEDLKIINFCNFHKLNFLVVLNKCDLVKPIELTKRIQVVKSQLGIFKFQIGQIIPVSALKLQNLNELRELLTKIYNNSKINNFNNFNSNNSSNSNDSSNNNNLVKDTKLIKDVNNNLVKDNNKLIKDNNKLINSSVNSNLFEDSTADRPIEDNLALRVGGELAKSGEGKWEESQKVSKLQIEGNLIKLNLDNLSILNSISQVTESVEKPKDLLDNNLITEKNELFDKRLANYLSTPYKVSKFKINRSYKRVFSLFKANLLKNTLLNYKMLRSSTKAKVNRTV